MLQAAWRSIDKEDCQVRLKNGMMLGISILVLIAIIMGCTPPTPTPTPAPPQYPNIASIRYSASCVKAGTQLMIYGRNFGDDKGISTVIMNGIVAATTYWSDNEVIAIVPTASLPASELREAVTVAGVPSDEYWLYGICQTPTPTPTPTPIPAERVDVARDIAIMKANSEGHNVPTGVYWFKQDLSSGIGGKHYLYTYSGAGDWYIDITYPIVPEPTFSVVISFESFSIWSGNVYYWETVPLM